MHPCLSWYTIVGFSVIYSSRNTFSTVLTLYTLRITQLTRRLMKSGWHISGGLWLCKRVRTHNEWRILFYSSCRFRALCTNLSPRCATSWLLILRLNCIINFSYLSGTVTPFSRPLFVRVWAPPNRSQAYRLQNMRPTFLFCPVN